MPESLHECDGNWHTTGCLRSIRVSDQTTPHMHRDGLWYVRCTHKRGCRVPGHPNAIHEAEQRIGSRFD